jgi:hypothetical protein
MRGLKILTTQSLDLRAGNILNTGLFDGGSVILRAKNELANVNTGAIFGYYLALEAGGIDLSLTTGKDLNITGSQRGLQAPANWLFGAPWRPCNMAAATPWTPPRTWPSANPNVPGVYPGDATNLKKVATGSQQRIIIENLYGYDPLNSEVLRVLQQGGTIEITGSMANPFVNKALKGLDGRGLELVETKTVSDLSKYTHSSGKPMNPESNLATYIIKKKE